MIPVLVAASSAVARAGLKAMLEELPDCTVAGTADEPELVELALELHPTVVLWQLAPASDRPSGDRPARVGRTLQALGSMPVLLLTDEGSSELLRAGARGVLPWNASAEQIGVAIQALALNLVVTVPQAGPAPERVAATLSARETEVLRMISIGLANKEIAFRLGISEHTVKFHVSALLGKLGVSTRAEAIRVGIRQGVILV